MRGADYGAVTAPSVEVGVRDNDKSFGEMTVTLTAQKSNARLTRDPPPTTHQGGKFRIGLWWSETRTRQWNDPWKATGEGGAIRVTGGTARPKPTPGYGRFTGHVLVLEITPESAGSDVVLTIEPMDCSAPGEDAAR